MLTRLIKLLKRKRVKFIVIILVIFLYFEININVQGSYFWRQAGRCRNSIEDDVTLRYLIISSHEILNRLNIHHFLVYGRWVLIKSIAIATTKFRGFENFLKIGRKMWNPQNCAYTKYRKTELAKQPPIICC